MPALPRALILSLALSVPFSVARAQPSSAGRATPSEESWAQPSSTALNGAPATISNQQPVLERGSQPRRTPASLDEDWSGFPAAHGVSTPSSSPKPSAPSGQAPTPPLMTAPPTSPREGVARLAPEAPEEPNTVSLYSGAPLGQWKRGFGVYLGFPLLGVKGSLGLTSAWDLGVSFESFYGWMNEVRLATRYSLYSGQNWSFALALEGGKAFFRSAPSADRIGARWLTGRRNWNVVPGFIVSVRGDGPRSARLFLDVRYQLSFDTQPYQRDPLGGVPAATQVGHNFPVHFGAEMPFTASTSFLFTLGFGVHGRAVDSTFMPSCGVGIVTSI